MFELARLRRVSSRCCQAESGPDARRRYQDRRAQGAFFTPKPLADLVVETTLAPLVDGLPVGRVPKLTVIDPACGDGRFLASAEAYLRARLQLEGTQAAELRRRCLVGIERDPQFAEAARGTVPGSEIVVAEALSSSRMAGGANAFIGNPPYLRSIHLGAADQALRDQLRGRFEATSFGEWDLYAAFLEHAYDMLAPGGQLGFVVPSRWLTASYASGLRAKLAERGAMRALIDFGSEQVFSDATTYASAVFLSRRRCEQMTVARLRSRQWSQGLVATSSLSATPWRLSIGATASRLQMVEGGRPRLGELARVVKGAGTNCDPVFHFEAAPTRSGKTRVYSRAIDAEVVLESAALRPCFRGREVPRVLDEPMPGLALVPYHRDGSLWAPATVQERYPLVWRYLLDCRQRLEARERGRFAGPQFYCFGRPQNMRLLMGATPRVVVPDVARGGRAHADRAGIFALDSAYAVVPEQPVHLEALAAILASPMVLWWLGERGVLLRGGYVRMKTAYLRELPVCDLDALSSRLEHCPDQWQRAVADGYGLSSTLSRSPEPSTRSATSSGRS
ncbi:MAG: Eco57I restriction-modification methylase domain-containing protein [Deltaproteobacteria bacterium]|nr:Eco57I restriction-modification methylase domain-containing protein [Deltaproteobacteria bacterium]